MHGPTPAVLYNCMPFAIPLFEFEGVKNIWKPIEKPRSLRISSIQLVLAHSNCLMFLGVSWIRLLPALQGGGENQNQGSGLLTQYHQGRVLMVLGLAIRAN